jgi:hypothetical protein
MAAKIHKVTSYNYSFDPRASGAKLIQLWSERVEIAKVHFVDDSATVPPPRLSSDLNSATVYFKRGAFSGLIDMLRNESPVSVTINDQAPGFVFIHTGIEPAGEGES